MPRHQDSRELPYTAQQMFDLVADIERYPEFLPWNSAARIRSRTFRDDGIEVVTADLVISFKVFREKFTSRVLLFPAKGPDEVSTIETTYMDGPFKHLHSEWRFEPRGDGGSVVAFEVDFEFKNALLQKLIGVVFHEAMSRIIRAFETRARTLYAPNAP